MLIVSIPSAIAGVILGGFIGPLFLLTVFGAGMLLLSIVFILPEKKILPKHPSLYDQKAHTHPWRFHFEKIDILFYILSSIGGLFVGMVSSGLGEANEYNLEQRLKMPPAIASGTSVFIVIVTALIASFVHVLDIFVSSDTSFLADVFSIIIFAGPGVILGAQLGVRASQRISHVGNCDWDIVNNELHWSDEVYHIFGLEPQESRATYNAYIRAIHPDDRMLVLEHINKAIYENKPYSIDYRILLPDGSELIVHEQAEVTFNETGQAIRMAGTVQDITVRKKAENAMFNAKLVAEAADKSKAEFIANMTHELRTPLNAVIGFSEMLMLGTFGTLNEKQTKYVNNITSSGKHLLDAINEILDLSKIEAGKMELHPEEFEVSSAIEEVNIMVASMAEKKRIAITADLADNTTVIEADKTKFKQILYNLLSNAIKFTDQGGSVTIGEKTLDDLVHISVKDSGIGISPEDQDKLFNPFFQVDSSSTREYGGTGLGLALIKKFVEMHGGEVWVESEVGKGSIFTFSIPMASKVQ